MNQPLRDRTEIIEYEVQKGDTISSIAQRFNLSVSTILWANELSRRSILRPGQKLIILPVDGVIHHVEKGDTLSRLAKLYQVKIEDIIAYNDIKEDGKIYIGDVLIIPHAKKPIVRYASKIVKPLPSSYFICPITPPCRITQGLHWYNAIDFSHGRCGDPILAAASGVVQKTGYSKIAGKYVRILHPNGVVTFYGHMSKIIVFPGQKVSQGQIIGYMGYTGYTIPRGPAGCHVHFEVRGARNPFAR
jgi:murein DD-endopeptidase MepM/ murein hydrolase activator NlpD